MPRVAAPIRAGFARGTGNCGRRWGEQSGTLGDSCLYGCFSKPPDVVVSNGGWLPTFRRACGTVAPRLSGVVRTGPEVGTGGRTDPAVWLLSRPNFGPTFASIAANTIYW